MSPWRMQALVVEGGNKKRRKVIDYSEAVNLFSDVDVYPISEVEPMLNRAAANTLFSEIAFKSTFHQIAIRTADRPFTAFEACGRLWQFTRNPFGVTNAMPVF